MKIRTGFVSNSSSSSFLIYGIELTSEEFGKFSNDYDYAYPEYYHGDGEYAHYFGISWNEVGDDETGREFKERVVKEVNEFLTKSGLSVRDSKDFGSQSYAWRDG